MIIFSILSYLTFAAVSVYQVGLLLRMSATDTEPTATGLAKASIIRNLLLGSAIYFAVLAS